MSKTKSTKIQNTYFNEKIESELKNYRKYLKYCRNEQINIGNRNWLVLDSNKSHYQDLVEELVKYNNFSHRLVNVVFEADFISQKWGLDNEKLIRTITAMSKSVTNIFVVSNISEDEALSKYGTKFTFFANFDTELSLNIKLQKINNIVQSNNFVLPSSVTEKLLKSTDEEIEKILTKAFIIALNEKNNIIKDNYLSVPKNTLKANLKSLHKLIGLTDVKATINEIVNYLTISQKRSSNNISMNMLFLGQPRDWKNNCCQNCSENIIFN